MHYYTLIKNQSYIRTCGGEFVPLACQAFRDRLVSWAHSSILYF